MDESLLTEEYLSKFPTILCEALKSSDKYRNRFLNRVKKEYSPIKVYRGIHKDNILEDDDFICNIEEMEKYGGGCYRKVNVEHYAISVNEDPKAIIKALSIPNVRHPWLGIAEGIMEQEYGPADFMNDATHHNWYLYKDAIPLMKVKFKITDECRRMISESMP